MKFLLGCAAALALIAGAARADDPATTAAPAGAPTASAPVAPPPPAAPVSPDAAQSAPAAPAPIPAAAHTDGPCGLVAIHKDLVNVEKEVRKSPAYGHAHKHYKAALHLMTIAMHQLNAGCHAYKMSLKKNAAKAASTKK